MRLLLLAVLLASTPASAEVALFSQREFQGARYDLEAASSNMTFSPRSVRLADTPWELCPRPFFGGTCLKIDSSRAKLSLPRAFSGMVRSARPLVAEAPAQESAPAAEQKKAEQKKPVPEVVTAPPAPKEDPKSDD